MIHKAIQTISGNAGSFARRLRPSAIVCHELKLLYFSIPKTASSSIKRYLRKHGYEPERKDIDEISAKEVHNFSYPRVSVTEANRLRKLGYTSIAVVRNPHLRLWSCYADKILIRRGEGRTIYGGFARYNSIFMKQIFSIEMDYPEFIRGVIKIPDIISDGHFRSQCRYLPFDSSKVDVDHVFDISSLDTNMARIMESKGLPSWEPRRTNPSSASKTKPSLSAEDVDLVCRRYTRDFHFLSYDMECPF